MQRSGRTSLTRPTCYRRTLAQVIERGYPSIRMTANGLARPCSAPRHGHPNAWHIGLELANVALTQRDLHRSLLGVREKSLIRKCSVNPRSSPEITKNRHFRVRVLHGQPRSPVAPALQGSFCCCPRAGFPNGARFASFGTDEIALRDIGSINFCEKSTSERGDAVIE